MSSTKKFNIKVRKIQLEKVGRRKELENETAVGNTLRSRSTGGYAVFDSFAPITQRMIDRSNELVHAGFGIVLFHPLSSTLSFFLFPSRLLLFGLEWLPTKR